MRCIVLSIVLLVSSVYSKGLQEEFTWTRVNYVWPTNVSPNNNVKPTPQARKSPYASQIVFPGSVTNDASATATNAGEYIFENNIPMGANIWQNKLFVTVPRRRAGVPSSLNYVWLNSTERHNVPLIPYPNWEINSWNPQREGIVSVYRTAVDACNRLWMVDTGLIEIPGNNTRVQPAAIIVIDLKTDTIIRRYTLKETDVLPSSTLASIVVDVTANDCNNAFAYIPDLSGYGLIVYNFQESDSWRITHNYFYLESTAGEFFVGGINFQWNDGIFSLALSNINSDGFRNAYFHSMAGTHIYSVSTRILRNQQLSTRSYHEDDFKIEVDRGTGAQTSSSDLHQNSGVLFLALVNQNALGCWNIYKNNKPSNFDVIFKDDKKFIYPCDVKVRDDQVIVLSNAMPVFLYSQLNYDEVNFRVWISNVNDAVKDTACARPRRGSSGRY